MERFIDEHVRRVDAPRDVVWDAVDRCATRMCSADRGVLGRLLATEPPSGFAVTERMPQERIVLAGRHRFARYTLVFDLTGASDASELRAQTYADFPGVRGRVYRALVVGSRAHAYVTRRILRSIS